MGEGGNAGLTVVLVGLAVGHEVMVATEVLMLNPAFVKALLS